MFVFFSSRGWHTRCALVTGVQTCALPSCAILPLPGGTLNLLSKALHGDRPAEDILADALAGRGRRLHPPIVRCDAGDAYITIVAGPATRWAEVRETLRSEEHTSELQSLMRSSYDVFCLQNNHD